ncbi:MAG: hypothetical protein Q9166_007849 [cf. Caloplaca sp. 2 TL-2023]
MNWVASLCIYYGIEDIIRQLVYKEVTILCEWNDIEMVEVSIRAASPSTDSANAASTPNTTKSTMSLLDTLQPHFFYVRDAETLDYTVAMITIMYSITFLSRLSKTAVVPQTYTDPGPHWDASILFPGDGPRPPSDQPHFLEYRWVIGTLRLVPNFMIRNRRFAELGIAFDVDNVYLGSALLQKGKPHQDILSEANTTAATA